ETLLTIARDPQRLGIELGFFAVLHSWGQTLNFHPHLHCVVPGGGLSPDSDRWIAARRRYLLPVKVLSRRFRRLMFEALQDAYAAGQLQFFGDLEPLRQPAAFARYLAPLQKSRWVVYAKPPFGGPQYVLEYLGRYTHRVAISNRRLLHLQDGQVSFQWKDYRDRQQPKVMTVSADEFIRRFLQHALPPGFQRIRYYGLLANCHRADKLDLCRRLLAPRPRRLPRPLCPAHQPLPQALPQLRYRHPDLHLVPEAMPRPTGSPPGHLMTLARPNSPPPPRRFAGTAHHRSATTLPKAILAPAHSSASLSPSRIRPSPSRQRISPHRRLATTTWPIASHSPPL